MTGCCISLLFYHDYSSWYISYVLCHHTYCLLHARRILLAVGKYHCHQHIAAVVISSRFSSSALLGGTWAQLRTKLASDLLGSKIFLQNYVYWTWYNKYIFPDCNEPYAFNVSNNYSNFLQLWVETVLKFFLTVILNFTLVCEVFQYVCILKIQGSQCLLWQFL